MFHSDIKPGLERLGTPGVAAQYWLVNCLRGRETAMPNSHLESLNARHARLDARLADESRRPVPDAVMLTKIKREKLKVKEALSRQS